MASASKVAKLSIPEENLLCPVCLTVPRSSPVRQCNKGHIVCQACYNTLKVTDDALAQKNCPTCREVMRDDNFSILGKELRIAIVNSWFDSKADKSLGICLLYTSDAADE